jgi:Dolichyl-phosphate-mannose-protein mannosyltransferase
LTDIPDHAEPDPDLALRFVRLGVLAILVLLLCRSIDAPFNAWHSLNDAVHVQFARNHIQYGLRSTALYSTWGSTLAPSAIPDRYLNHPPLVAFWTAGPLWLFGDHEWSARLFPISATLASAALLMTILGRLGRPGLGVLTGFFFATLPLTAYFGRMIDHEAPAQFFTLLMIHGYLEWTGTYGASSRPRRGALAYATGAVLGTFTAWAVLPAAGLIWAWHAARVGRRGADSRILAWLTAIPALAFLGVVLHILAACGWDFSMLEVLLEKRSLGGAGGLEPWSAWLSMQWVYLKRSFTPPGALAAILGVPLIAAAAGNARVRAFFPLAGNLAAVAVLCGAHGLLWVLAFKNQSWFHDYWQFFLGPYVALAMAALVVAVHGVLAPKAPRLALVAVAVLLVIPMPFAAAALDFYAAHRLVDPDYISTLVQLRDLTPRRAPVCTSHHLHESTESFGPYTYRWSHPVIAYYADRPLFFSRSLSEIEANEHECVAYILQRSEQPWSGEIEAALASSFESVPASGRNVIFLLDRSLSGHSPKR